MHERKSQAGIERADFSPTDIVVRIVNGDKLAEQELVTRYHKGISAILYKQFRDRELVSDVIQDTWIIVLNKIRDQRLEKPESLKAFIIQTAKYQALMSIRRKRPTEQIDDHTHSYETKEPSPDEAMYRSQLQSIVKQIIFDLPVVRDQQLLYRYYSKGESKEDLCQLLELSPEHFDRVLYRAKKRFKALLEEKQLDTLFK